MQSLTVYMSYIVRLLAQKAVCKTTLWQASEPIEQGLEVHCELKLGMS